MEFDRETAAESARQDLSGRIAVGMDDISTVGIEDVDFPDASLGAPVDGEMAAMMISSGWRITLAADGKKYEYRADKYQLRLYNFSGENIVIFD